MCGFHSWKAMNLNSIPDASTDNQNLCATQCFRYHERVIQQFIKQGQKFFTIFTRRQWWK